MHVASLMHAVQALKTEDALPLRLSLVQWQQLGAHMQRRELQAGALLFERGSQERCAYLVESGHLQVFVAGGPPGSHRLATLRAGAMFGEAALFAAAPRLASVEATTACVVWCLGVEQLASLAEQEPRLALSVLQAAGAVLAARLRACLERGMPSA